MKKLFIILLFIIISSLGRHLLPNNYFFTFHDSTQPARIQQFVKELKNFHIPPRVAPDMNYQLGYPVFNFYAPASYWITSVINIIGFDVVNSLKLSFLLALIVGFLGTYLFFKKFFDFLPSILGGFFYITSLYFPLNIFVRGNLAETWFLALLPFALFLIYENSLKINKKTFFLTSIILSLLITSHNILSLVSIPIIIIFIALLKNKKNNFFSLFFVLVLSAYFWLPAIVEMKYTWAKEVATKTNFNDHFLCLTQLWQSMWGFGGSTKGCLNDGMSFMIGKIQITFFILGIIL
ncbi:MAG: 6-pyruvoyl-tetrahydropterin synthase-related protein, partial [Microgenomates group bacterium]